VAEARALAVVEKQLVKPLAQKEAGRSRFSRAYIPPHARRVRVLDRERSTDGRGAEFVAFAVDERSGVFAAQAADDSRRWRKDAIIALVRERYARPAHPLCRRCSHLGYPGGHGIRAATRSPAAHGARIRYGSEYRAAWTRVAVFSDLAAGGRPREPFTKGGVRDASLFARFGETLEVAAS